MSSDLLILTALREKQKYRTLAGSVPKEMLGQDAQWLLQWYPVYWEAYPTHEYLDVDSLCALIKLRCSSSSREQIQLALHQASRLQTTFPADSVAGVVMQLTELELAGRLGSLLTKYQNGGEVELAHEVSRMSQDTLRNISQSAPTDWIDDSIESILKAEGEDYGLKFPTTVLREHIKGLLGGASIAIGARPDKGKTSLIAFILAHFAKQVDQFFDPDRPILWLNNEGKGQRIVPRLYQAALGLKMPELIHLSNEGKLAAQYAKAVGRADRIRVKDMHGASLAQIETVIEAMRPCVVVWDMLANFRLPGAGAVNKADETEQKWQQAREMAVRHDFVSMATVQVSAEGGNMLFPPYSALKDSKTGIQGATDIILMLGALDSAEMSKLRGIATPKNKFQMPGKPGHVEAEIVFQADTCQFTDGV
jgi:hypothetical protein